MAAEQNRCRVIVTEERPVLVHGPIEVVLPEVDSEF